MPEDFPLDDEDEEGLMQAPGAPGDPFGEGGSEQESEVELGREFDAVSDHEREPEATAANFAPPEPEGQSASSSSAPAAVASSAAS